MSGLLMIDHMVGAVERRSTGTRLENVEFRHESHRTRRVSWIYGKLVSLTCGLIIVGSGSSDTGLYTEF